MSYNHKLLSEKVSSFLHQSPSVSLGCLCRELGVSRRTIQTAVSAATGKKFSQLREEVLVTKVRCLFMLQPEWAIKQVSFEVGYKSARSFARAIKRASGLSPEELRSRMAQEAFALRDKVCA